MTQGIRWISPNLSLGYHFSDANDFGAGGYTLSDTSGATNDVDGFGGYCVGFDGTSNLYRTASSPTTNNDFSISFWVKFLTVADSTTYGIFRWANSTAGYMYTRFTLVRSGSTYTLKVYPSSATSIDYVIPSFATGKWYHIAASHASGGNTTLFFNGNTVGTPGAGTSTAVTNIYIGYDNLNSRMIGRIDELVIYNTTMTAQQVRRLYADGKGVLD